MRLILARRGHADLLSVVPILTDDRRRKYYLAGMQVRVRADGRVGRDAGRQVRRCDGRRACGHAGMQGCRRAGRRVRRHVGISQTYASEMALKN